MMIDLMTAARGAVFRAVKAGFSSTPVFTEPPEDTAPPFVTIGAIDSDPTGAKGEQVERITIEVISIYRGTDRGVLLGMMHSARNALDRQPITATGVVFQPPRLAKASASDAAPDGVTYAGISTFIIDAEPA